LDEHSPLAASKVDHQKLDGCIKQERGFTNMRLGRGTVQSTVAASSPRHRHSDQIEEDDDTKAVMPGDATSALSAPWEHLLSSTISPAAAVAVKMAISEDEPEPSSSSRRRAGSATENGGLLGTIHRHLPSLSRLSLGAAAAAAAKTKGDQGAPLFRLEHVHQFLHELLLFL
jgi:hypothetical protein